MPPYVKVEDSQIDFNSGIGEDTFLQGRDNQENFNDRITSIEGQTLIAAHFNFEDGSSATDASLPPYDIWLAFKGTGATYRRDSFSSFTIRCEAGGEISLRSSPSLQFDTVGKSILFASRQKLSADGAFKIGIGSNQSGALSGDAHGIWLERVDASNWRFVSFDTARNNGASFADIADATYFDVDIEFTDTPSNRAICKIDGVVKETFTTQLPIAKHLHIGFGYFAGSTRDMEIDRVKLSSGALIDLT